MKDCEYFESKIIMFIDCELAETESLELKQHLNSCKSCSGLLDDLKNRDNLFQKMVERPISEDKWKKIKTDILQQIEITEPSDDCLDKEPLICMYIDNELEQHDITRLESHLACCENCRNLCERWLAQDKLFQKTLQIPLADERWKRIRTKILNKTKPTILKSIFASVAAAVIVALTFMFLKPAPEESTTLVTISDDPVKLLSSGEVMIYNILYNPSQISKIQEVAITNGLSERYSECELKTNNEDVQIGFRILRTVSHKIQKIDSSEIASLQKSLNDSGAIEKINKAKELLLSPNVTK